MYSDEKYDFKKEDIKEDPESSNSFASFVGEPSIPESQPEEEKPKKQTYKKKSMEKKPKILPEVLPVALKSCTVHLDGCSVDLVKGRVIEGLKSQELKHLKFHGFVK